jgi:hypothetical protein
MKAMPVATGWPGAFAQPVAEADPENQQQKRQVHVNVDPGDTTQFH